MPNKRKNLQVKTKAKSVMGKRVANCGAIVNGPITGNQQIESEIETLVAEEDALVVGALVDGHARKKS